MEVEILAKSMKPHNICDVLRDHIYSLVSQLRGFTLFLLSEN